MTHCQKFRFKDRTMGKQCGIKMEVYSRAVGYYRPTSQWNPGKREEFKDRVTFKVNGGAHERTGANLSDGTAESWNPGSGDTRTGKEKRLSDNATAQAGPGAQERDGKEKPAEKQGEVNHERTGKS